MGRGNYLPDDSGWRDYELFYVALPIFDDEDEADDFYGDLCRRVDEALPESFGRASVRRSAENGLLEVTVEDNDWSYAVVIRPHARFYDGDDNRLALACRHARLLAESLMRKMHASGYEIYERSGPWSSTRWMPC